MSGEGPNGRKLALLGDIHGNRLALQAVLDEVAREGIDRLLITGDVVGYYFWPRECLEAILEWNVEIVRGNHEDMLLRARKDPDCARSLREKYGTGIEIALAELDESQLTLIESWPRATVVVADHRRLLLCHGSPRDTNEYVYPDAPPEQLASMVSDDASAIVHGHTHYSAVRSAHGRIIINPGSVGQPRNGQIGACWATYDIETGEAELRLTSYDVALVAEEARRRHPDLPYLHRVLRRT